MAILQQIRKRNVFLIAIIGLALFAFVISGIINKGVSSFQQPTEIGSVNGEEIPILPFRQQVESAVRNLGQGVTTSQAVNYVWEQNVNSMLLDQQFEKLGIDIGKDEILNIVSQNPQISQNPMFLNEVGLFDKKKFVDYIASLKSVNPEAFAQWQVQEDNIVEGAKRQMYLGLILAGLSVTKFDSEVAYRQEADEVSVDYVLLPYSSISDSLVNVSDSDIKSYIDEHKKEFQREASRDIQFVVVSEEASEEDKDLLKQQLMDLLKPYVVEYNSLTSTNDTVVGFSRVENLREFVERNSDLPYDTLYVAKENLPIAVADDLYNLSEGEVYGPYEDAGYYKLTKLVGKKKEAEARASHILIAYKGSQGADSNISRTRVEAEDRAKQILSELNSGSIDFATLAREKSDGPSASRGGDLGYFQKGMMVPKFEDFVFANKVGALGIVETPFGFHVIKVVDKREAAKFATIARKIEASENTVNEAYVEATKFEMEVVGKKDSFSVVAKEMGLALRNANGLKENDEVISGLGNNRQLVQWTFDKETKVGDVRRFNTAKGYVVAQLTKKNKKGLASVQEVAPYVKPIIVREKKADLLVAKLKEGDLNFLASKNGVQVESFAGIVMKNPVFAGRREPKVVGSAFGLKEGDISKPIIGENGVYVIKITNSQITSPLSDYKDYSYQLRTLKVNSALEQVLYSLKESSNIVDNRSSFY